MRVLNIMLLFASAAGLALPANIVTPIGPFCPFRSTAAPELDGKMAGLTETMMPTFAAEMARIQLTMQTGGEPDKARVRELADQLTTAHDEWMALMTRMQGATDFQLREYFRMTTAWGARQGEDLATIGLMMRWQADNMRSYADGGNPVMPPPGLDLEKLMKMEQQGANGGGAGVPANMMSQLSAAQGINSQPFNEEALESDLVRDEFKAICQSHSQIIKLGEQYGTFDPLGKIAYLDALEAIEDRWDVFVGRFELMGALNSDFREQTGDFLNSMGMSVGTFREVLQEAHDSMRRDAEAERAQNP